MSIEELKNRLQKNVKGTYIEILDQSNIASIEKHFETPSYDLNRIVSGSLYRGFPEKTVTCLVAPEGVFKSSLMAITAAKAQKQGYTPVIIDTEGAWTSDFCERWGVDTSNMLHVYTIFVEEITTMFGDILNNKDENLFIILDSMGGLESDKIIRDTTQGDKVAKADQGGLARKIKRMLKMYVSICKSQNSAGMFAGHWYGKPNAYGASEDIGGGKYVKLAADIIIAMKKQQIYLDPKAKASDRVVIGSEIKAMTLKNRFCPPFQEATIQIDYKNGVSPYAGLLNMALSCGIIQVGGAWYTLPNGDKVQGANKVSEYFKENPTEILEELEEILKTTGYSTENIEVKDAVRLAEEEKKDKKNEK